MMPLRCLLLAIITTAIIDITPLADILLRYFDAIYCHAISWLLALMIGWY